MLFQALHRNHEGIVSSTDVFGSVLLSIACVSIQKLAFLLLFPLDSVKTVCQCVLLYPAVLLHQPIPALTIRCSPVICGT